jgi:hypothetical protein
MADWVLQIEAPAKEEMMGRQSGETETGWQHQDEALVNKQTQGQPEVPEKEQMMWEQHAMGQQLAEVPERGN